MEFLEENWLIFSIVAGIVAKSIGRSFWKYFFLSLFLSPVIGFVVLLIKGKKVEEKVIIIQNETEEGAGQEAKTYETALLDEMKYCSACGAPLNPKAKYCSNCGILIGQVISGENTKAGHK